MVRPKKDRMIAYTPECIKFGPKGYRAGEQILLKLEEYESIRLMDLEGLTQQECADKMHIGRTTLQRIYKSARRKIADSIINGNDLVILDNGNNIKFKNSEGEGKHRKGGGQHHGK